ncbi:acyl-CoA thioesterase [Paenibacillus albiflavus]|uniref:Acyl-CoA thioesterase n=1 Tax=Paenibacillus albiflavus TaxID=2545760 RepID=A0A4R4EBM7_9BACL|nr:thioesterase family protein [Paenibacillus albiflavus]TCZ75305.1 acyl-CoA thioesterase [Paenibacillus albiflavus]
MPGQWHHHAIRVRYQETDQMRVVYHANYLNWFEIGRTELIREMGFPYTAIEQAGLMLPVIHAELDYRKPARYDDIISIYTRIEACTRVRLEMAYQVHRREETDLYTIPPFAETDGREPAGELLVSGLTKHVWVNKEFKTTRLDHALPELHKLIDSYN